MTFEEAEALAEYGRECALRAYLGGNVTIADALESERRRQDFTVYRLAKDSGMSAGRLHAILDGTTANPGILTVGKILAVLGKSLGWLERQTKANDR